MIPTMPQQPGRRAVRVVAAKHTKLIDAPVKRAQAALRTAAVLQARPVRLPWECFVCGAMGLCAHREPKVIVAEWERRKSA